MLLTGVAALVAVTGGWTSASASDASSPSVAGGDLTTQAHAARRRGRRGRRGPRGPRGLRGRQGTPGATGPPGPSGTIGAVSAGKLFFRVSGPTSFTTIGGIGTLLFEAACTGGVPQLRARTSADNGVIKASSISSAQTARFVELDDMDVDQPFDISGGLGISDSAIVHVSYLDAEGVVVEAQLGFEQAPSGFDCSVTGIVHGAS